MKGSTIFCPEGLEVSEKEELQPGAGSKCDQAGGKQLPHKIFSEIY